MSGAKFHSALGYISADKRVLIKEVFGSREMG